MSSAPSATSSSATSSTAPSATSSSATSSTAPSLTCVGPTPFCPPPSSVPRKLDVKWCLIHKQWMLKPLPHPKLIAKGKQPLPAPRGTVQVPDPKLIAKGKQPPAAPRGTVQVPDPKLIAKGKHPPPSHVPKTPKAIRSSPGTPTQPQHPPPGYVLVPQPQDDSFQELKRRAKLQLKRRS